MAQQQTAGKQQPHFDTEWMLGGMRDHVLGVVKKHVDWSKLAEKKQVSIANEVEQASRQAIREAVRIVHGHGFETVGITVSGMKQTKEGLVEAKFTCAGTQDNVLAVFSAGRCSMVLADPETFMGAAAAEIMKDQPDLMDKPAETAKQRERAESDARAEQFTQTETVEPLEDTLAKTAEGTSTTASGGERANETDGALIDNETGEVLASSRQVRSPRGHRGRKALPVPAEA